MTRDAVLEAVATLRDRDEAVTHRAVLQLTGGSKRDVSKWLKSIDQATAVDASAPTMPTGGRTVDEHGAVDQARATLAQAQTTLTRAHGEQDQVTQAAAITRERYHAAEATRLRTGADPSSTKSLRENWTQVQCQVDILAGVITSLQRDVSTAEHALQAAERQAAVAYACQEWNTRVPLQREAMIHLQTVIAALEEAIAAIVTLAQDQAPHGQLLGLGPRADARLFRGRALQHWLEFQVGRIFPGLRPPAGIYSWMLGKTLQELNTFAVPVDPESHEA